MGPGLDMAMQLHRVIYSSGVETLFCINAGGDVNVISGGYIPAALFRRHDAEIPRQSPSPCFVLLLTGQQPADDKRCRQPRSKKRGQHDANMHQIISRH